jgi:Protein of unknown function (DUF2798)
MHGVFHGAAVMTAVITAVNLGFPPDYLLRWMKAFAIAWPIAAVVAFLAVPLARSMTAWIVGRLAD